MSACYSPPSPSKEEEQASQSCEFPRPQFLGAGDRGWGPCLPAGPPPSNEQLLNGVELHAILGVELRRRQLAFIVRRYRQTRVRLRGQQRIVHRCAGTRVDV